MKVYQHNEESMKCKQIGEDILGDGVHSLSGMQIDFSWDRNMIIVSASKHDECLQARVSKCISEQWIQQGEGEGEGIEEDNNDDVYTFNVALSEDSKRISRRRLSATFK